MVGISVAVVLVVLMAAIPRLKQLHTKVRERPSEVLSEVEKGIHRAVGDAEIVTQLEESE